MDGELGVVVAPRAIRPLQTEESAAGRAAATRWHTRVAQASARTGGVRQRHTHRSATIPRPNDLRLQQTGTASSGSASYRLRSTAEGTPLPALCTATGVVDVSQVGPLSGGVVTAATTAGAARSKEPPARRAPA